MRVIEMMGKEEGSSGIIDMKVLRYSNEERVNIEEALELIEIELSSCLYV